MKEKLLELIKEETDTYAFEEIVDSNYNVNELKNILATLIMFNQKEEGEE